MRYMGVIRCHVCCSCIWLFWGTVVSRNCLKSGGGGRAATTSHLCKEGCLLFTPGSFHSWRKPTFISPASHLYLNYCDIYRPPDEVTTILSRKLVEAKIKKKSKSRSFNFPQQMQENLQSYLKLVMVKSMFFFILSIFWILESTHL